MKRYVVTLRAVVEREMSIEAESPHEAARQVKERIKADEDAPAAAVLFGGMKLHEVEELETDEDGEEVRGESWDVFSACEACDRVLFCDDDVASGSDEDAVYLCRPCADKAVEESGADEEPVQGGDR